MQALPQLGGTTCVTDGGLETVLIFHRVTDDIPPDGLTVGTARFRAICRLLQHRFRVAPVG